MAAQIVPFDPETHDLSQFRTGEREVDSFFDPEADFNLRDFWELQLGDVAVAVDGGDIAGCIAYLPRTVPYLLVKAVLPLAWTDRSEKPAERDGEISAVRIAILGVLPNCRRRGVGGELLRYALSRVTAPICYLYPVADAISFYRKAGFSLVDAGDQTFMFKPAPFRAFPSRFAY